MIEYQVLGPVQMVDGDRVVELGGPRQRRLLTALLVRCNAVVSTDQLVDAVFAGAPSPRAAATLRSYVTRLRRAVGDTGPGVLRRQGHGYVLAIDDDAFDVARFARLAADGRRQLDYGDAASAVGVLRHALEVWRGDAYAGLADEPWVRPEARRLEEMRHAVHEQLVDAELECGRAAEMVAVLEQRIASEPLRDAYRSRMMLALYRAGRPADALAAYRDYRALLLDELGVDPGPELVELQRRILAHDPTLRQTEPAGRPLRGYRLGTRLGTGRCGTVFAARLPQVPRDYAIRVYTSQVADAAVFVRSFEADARRVAALDHPAVVSVYDAWREPGAAALVMRRMTGGTLRDRLDAGDLSRADVAAIFERVGDALVFAARRGVVHGNLRAGSVFLDDHGRAHLGDFTVGGAPSPTIDDGVAFVDLVGRALIAAGDAPRDDGWSAAIVDPAIDREDIAQVVDGVLSWLRTDPVIVAPPPNPYVGLRAFDEPDADRFFGREALVDEMVRRLAGAGDAPRLLLVVGGSGSGKSSAVRAGLVPRLRCGDTDHDWLPTVMLPGSTPFKELAQALRRVTVGHVSPGIAELHADGLATVVDHILPEGARLLLVIDQFDELFSLVAEVDRDRFLRALVHAVTASHGRLHVVATLRADYFDRPLEHPRFGPLVHGRTLTVPAMSSAQLETAVTGPAADLDIESGLVAELVSSVVDQPAALPALQFTLYELAARGGARLTRADLEALGGVDGSIATRAEQLFTASTDDERRVIRQMFERLVVVGATGEPTRRRALRSELVAATDVERATTVDDVVEGWVQARLLTSDRHPETREPTVEVAHEAVLHRWPRLLGWIEADREWLHTLTQLQEAARTWHELGEDPGALLRGARLERALEVTSARDGAVPQDVARFLDASVGLRDTEVAQEAAQAAQQIRTTRRLRTQRVLLGIALALAVVIGGAAIDRQMAASRSAADAARNAAAADARAQAATAGLMAASDEALDSDWSLALLLAAEARAIDDSPGTRRGLLNALINPRPIPTVLHEQPNGYQALVVDEQRGLVIAKDPLGPINIVDLDTGDAVGQPLAAPQPFRVGGIALGDGLVAAAGLATDGVGAMIYDLDTRERVAEIDAEPDELTEVAFSPDGRYLAVTGVGRVRVFDADGWTRVATLTSGGDEPLPAVSWSDDGTTLYAGDFAGMVFSWTIDRAARADAAVEPTRRAAIATDPEPTPLGTILPIPETGLLAVAALDTRIFIIEADTLRTVAGPLEHDNSVFGMAVDPDGRRLAVATVNQIAVWSLQLRRFPDGDVKLDSTPQRDMTLLGDGADAAFSSSGDLITAGLGGQVTSWEMDPTSPVFDPIPDAGPGIPQFSPDGDVLAMSGQGAGVRLLDADTYELRAHLDIPEPEQASIATVAFVPGTSRMVVTWCADTDPLAAQPCPAQLAVFDRGSGRAVVGPVEIEPIADWVPSTVAASPDGKLLAVGYAGGMVEVRDAATLEVTHTLDDIVRDGQNFVIDMGFSPRQPTQLTATTADDAAVWDLSGATPALVVKGRTGLTTRFTPDGRLVTSDQDGTVEVRDPATLDVVDRVEHLPWSVGRPSFTRDGSLMVTSDDITAAARLWLLDDLALFGGPIEGLSGTIHPSGSTVVLGGEPVRQLRMDPDAWSRAACRTAGRALTRIEWRRYFADESYHPTCGAP